MQKVKQKTESEKIKPADVKAARVKYFLQMLDVKSDTNMIRVYSILKSSSFINTNQ